MVVWCDNVGLVSLILLSWELHVSYLYLCTMCTRHPILSPLLFMPSLYSTFTFTLFLSFLNPIPNLKYADHIGAVSSNTMSSKKTPHRKEFGLFMYSTCTYIDKCTYIHKLYRRFACKHYTVDLDSNACLTHLCV